MKPLYVQLKDRYARLKEIRESLWSLEIETLPSEMIEQLDIDFCPLDINTGATSDSVTPYFLPRVSFPSCRDLRSEGRLKDQMIDEGQDRDPRAAFESSVLNRFFPTCLELSQKYYAANLDWDLFHRILRKEERRYGWLAGVGLGGKPRKRDPHYFGRGIRFRADNLYIDDDVKGHDNEATSSGLCHSTLSDITLSSESPSHGMMEITVHHCHKQITSISEVVAVIDEILHSMRAQRKELRLISHGESPITFHHILPRLIQVFDSDGNWRLIYAYFDGSRLKIQFTELVDFAPFAVRPPPNMDYLDLIDLSQYDDKLDKMLKWAWPVIQGHTGKEGLKEKEREEGSEEKNK